jgi:hypothetical protein
LRAEASTLLVDAALAAETEAYFPPSITFLSPPEGVVDDETPLGPVPGNLRSALVAEEETARFEPALWRNAAVCVHTIEAADNPEVAGSNPAAATSKGPGNRAFPFRAQIDAPDVALRPRTSPGP